MDHDWLVGDFSSEAEEARPKGIESDIALERGRFRRFAVGITALPLHLQYPTFCFFVSLVEVHTVSHFPDAGAFVLMKQLIQHNPFVFLGPIAVPSIMERAFYPTAIGPGNAVILGLRNRRLCTSA